jgi:VanZ family protein
MAYAVFAFLVARAISACGISASRTVTIAVLICGLYGVSDEIHQAFVPTRTPDVFDAWFDLAGSLLGAAAWAAVARKARLGKPVIPTER